MRNLSTTQKFSATNPFRMSGNQSANARIDNVIYEGVHIDGVPLTMAEVQSGGGVGEYVTNVTVCESGCGEGILPAGSHGWTREEVCGLAPQPFIAGEQLPQLTGPLAGCPAMPPRPPPPPLPPPPPSPPAPPAPGAGRFCTSGDLRACEAALRSPSATVGTCSADFEHVQPVALAGGAETASYSAAGSDDRPVAAVIRIEALYIDLKGNLHSDLTVVGVIYDDAGGAPARLLAKTRPVLVRNTAVVSVSFSHENDGSPRQARDTRKKRDEKGSGLCRCGR